MNQILKKAKVAKKVIRFGNLNSHLRAKFWQKTSDQEAVVIHVREMAQIEEESGHRGSDVDAAVAKNDMSNVDKLYATLMEKIVDDETRLTPKIRDEISKDLARTRTSERIRTAEG